MPELDGIQTTRMIREFELKEHFSRPAYIVALTGNALDEDKQFYSSAGMNNFLSKPFTEGELRLILMDVAKRQDK